MGTPQHLRGPVALVTGAGRDLGRAYTRPLADHGASVAFDSRTAEATSAVVAAIRRDSGEAIACLAI